MTYTKKQLIRSVASSTAIETGQSVEEIERMLMDKNIKQNAHQDIQMQLDRLTEKLDALYNYSESNYGGAKPVTRKIQEAVLYFHALKCDLEAIDKKGYVTIIQESIEIKVE